MGTGRIASRRVDGMGVAFISRSEDGGGLRGIGMHVGSEDSPISSQNVEGDCSEIFVGLEIFVELGLGVDASGAATDGAGDTWSYGEGGCVSATAEGTGCNAGEGISGNNADGLDGSGDGVCCDCGLESSCMGIDSFGCTGSAVGLEVISERMRRSVC